MDSPTVQEAEIMRTAARGEATANAHERCRIISSAGFGSLALMRRRLTHQPSKAPSGDCDGFAYGRHNLT